MTTRWRCVRYPGTTPDYDGRVVYFIRGRSVYFTSIPVQGRELVTTTVNSAEEIVQVICLDAQITWKDYVFYDVQTRIGYPHHPPGWYVFELLSIEESGRDAAVPSVTGWQGVRGSEDCGEYVDAEAHVPAEVLQLFQRFISGEVNPVPL